MAFGESLLEVDPVTGIAVGIGATVLWPLASRVGRPIAKEAVKAGLRLYRAGESIAAEVRGIAAEADAETKPGAASTHASGSSAQKKRTTPTVPNGRLQKEVR